MNSNAHYSFRDVFDAIAGSQKIEEVLDLILLVCQRELDADQGSILLLDTNPEGEQQLEMLASRGLPEDIVRRGYVPRAGSISDYVIKERRPLIINDVPRTENFETMLADTSRKRRIVSAICVPLIAQERVLGTLNLNRTKTYRGQFSDEDLEAASIVAGQASMVIENRRLHDELQQQARLAAVGQTVAGISHCVKNILTGVKGGLGLAEMGLKQDNMPLVSQGYDLLKRNVGSLSNLVLDLLDYSKEREPARSRFDLVETLNDVKASLEHKGKALGVKIILDAPASLPFEGDADQIFRALMNLAGNAVEASGERRGGASIPEVRLSIAENRAGRDDLTATMVSRNSEWVRIDVADNGPGIPKEIQDRIWDLFFSTKGSKGTGIGLAASRKMIEEHGGRIRLNSHPDTGTTFTILLPVMHW